MNKNAMVFNVLIVISMIIWGGSWVSAKILTRFLDPVSLTFLRFFVSVVFFIPLIVLKKTPLKIEFRKSGYLMLGAISMGLYFLLFFKGLEKGYANMGGVFVTSLVPIYTLLLVKFFMKKSFNKIDIIGVVVGMIGGLIIVRFWEINSKTLFLTGNIYFLICPLLWAIVTICSEKSAKDFSSITFAFYCHVFCALFFIFLLKKNFYTIFSLNYVFWGNIFYLSVISSILATTLYFYSATKINSYRASVFTFIVPVSSLVLSMIFLKEKPEISTIIGGTFSIMAVILINLKKT